ncbi:glucose 1-dehydrogenase [Ectothiorhodospiraceae bacterium WFHF3C12]|nr:glucose 1-dehydrogenase [Ectothiorhodospiraceae bacterium WFHF3C12]
MNLFDLSGNCTIVTGAGRGIGRALATGFAEAGSDLVVCSRTQSELDELAGELAGRGVRVLPVACDVTDQASVQAMTDSAVAHFGRVDVLINNAGMTTKKPAEDYTPEDWQRIIAVNLTGVFFVAQAVGRHMIREEGGRIINISSIAAQTAITGSVAYCASKGGVDMVTRVLAAEWAQHGIRVNGLAPAYTETPLVQAITEQRSDFADRVKARTPLGRMARPEEMVGTAIYLASEASSYVTGETVHVDGGWTALGF